MIGPQDRKEPAALWQGDLITGPAEFAKVVSLCRLYLDGHAEALGDITKSATWDAVIDVSKRHGVLGVVYRAASGQDPAGDRLQYAATAIRLQVGANLHACAEAVSILEDLERRDVQAVILKGPLLASLVYRNVGDRAFSDIDILVQPGDVSAACDVLRARGYSGQHLPGEIDSGKDAWFERAADGAVVELHWRLNENWRLFRIERGLWGRLQQTTLAGRTVHTLSLEDTLLFLAVHGAKHDWQKLIWILDIACLLRTQTPEWSELIERAEDAGCYRVLLVALCLASEVFGADLPFAIRGAIDKDWHVRELARSYWQTTTGSCSDPIGPFVRRIRVRERLRDRVSLLAAIVRHRLRPTSADGDGVHLPQSFALLLYLTRPVRLLRSYGLKWVWAAVSGGK